MWFHEAIVLWVEIGFYEAEDKVECLLCGMQVGPIFMSISERDPILIVGHYFVV